MTARYCIRQNSDLNWIILDHQAGPYGNEVQPISHDFGILIDAIHYMFSHGHGEFFVKKS